MRDTEAQYITLPKAAKIVSYTSQTFRSRLRSDPTAPRIVAFSEKRLCLRRAAFEAWLARLEAA